MHEQDLLCITESVVFFTEAYRDFILSLGTVFYRSASLYSVDEYYILILLLTVPRRAEGSCNQFVILSKNCYTCISKSYNDNFMHIKVINSSVG